MSLARNLTLAAAAALGTGLLTAAAVRGKRHFRLAGKVCVVTGGSRGLGLEISRQLVDRGASVAICARDEEELAEARDELGREGDVFAAPCDVTDDADVKRFVSQVREHFGRIDVLVNNAGIIVVGPAETMTMDDYDHVMAINHRGPLRMMLEVLPEMTRRGAGRVVNVASIGGLMPMAHLAAYCASKHALVGLTTAMRPDLVRRGVYLSLVCPGGVATGSTRHALYKGDVGDEYAWFAAADNIPGVAASPRTVARAVLRAIETGDAVRVTPPIFRPQPMFHGAFPGVHTELIALAGRGMPDHDGPDWAGGERVPGHAIDEGLPPVLQQRQEAAEARYNQA